MRSEIIRVQAAKRGRGVQLRVRQAHFVKGSRMGEKCRQDNAGLQIESPAACHAPLGWKAPGSRLVIAARGRQPKLLDILPEVEVVTGAQRVDAVATGGGQPDADRQRMGWRPWRLPVRRAVIMADGKRVTARDLELTDTLSALPPQTLKEARENVERYMVQDALRRNRTKVTAAALELGISRPTLYELMEKLGITRNS